MLNDTNSTDDDENILDNSKKVCRGGGYASLAGQSLIKKSILLSCWCTGARALVPVKPALIGRHPHNNLDCTYMDGAVRHVRETATAA